MWSNAWLAERHAEDPRRFQQLLLFSMIAHGVLFAALAVAPAPAPPPLPEILRVDLVAGLPAQRSGRSASKAPAPAPPRAAPAPKPKQVVLPKRAPKAVPKRVPPPTTRPEPIEYDDALAQLRSELGEETPAPGPATEDVSDAELLATTKPGEKTGSGGGSAIDKETAEWVRATKRHVRSKFVTPPEFRNRGLATLVSVKLSGTGAVLGTPQVVRPSGDPFFDDNAVSTVMRATPLPAPPSAGTWTFSFTGD